MQFVVAAYLIALLILAAVTIAAFINLRRCENELQIITAISDEKYDSAP